MIEDRSVRASPVSELRQAGRERRASQDRRGGLERRHLAQPVPVEARLPLISAYLDKWGGSGGVKEQFGQLPDPADHPAFRLVRSP